MFPAKAKKIDIYIICGHKGIFIFYIQANKDI